MKRQSTIEVNMKRKEQRKKGIDKQQMVQDYTIYENLQKKEYTMTKEDEEVIKQALKQHFVFYTLNDIDQEKLIKKFFYCVVKPEQYLFKQGDVASCFFIVQTGEVSVIINEEHKKNLKRGDSFGELALLYNSPRSGSIKSNQETYFWALDRMTFKNTIEEITDNNFQDNIKFLEHVKIMINFTEDQKQAIARQLITQKFSKGQNIVNEGDVGNSFYIIKKGQVSAIKRNKEVRKLGVNDSFGEGALISENSKRALTIKAYDDEVVCLSLGKENLVSILGDNIQKIITKNNLRWAIEKSKHLSKLTPMQLEKIFDYFQEKTYKANDVIFQKGHAVCKRLVICQNSSILRSDDRGVIASKGQCFHDSFFIKNYRDKAFDEDVLVSADGIVYELHLEDLVKCIGGELEDVIKKNAQSSHEVKMKEMQAKKVNTNFDTQLANLTVIQKLGQGQFGNVYLVKSKQDGELYAIKCIKKNQIIQQNLEKYLKQEKTVCQMVNFPFCMQFIRSFKDEYHIFFLLQFIKGMELFDAIREIGLLGTYDSQFYIAQMILAVEYLHNLKIVYRDIKPENIMVDENGYLKMIDMGTAKILVPKYGVSRTFTIIGTPHYMAPEIINGKGYNFTVDLWSIGVCLYEFMCGYVPFGDDAEDPYDIYQDIMSKNLSYPSYMKDKKAIKLIEQLLNKIPEIRLGQSYAALKGHTWFNNFNWDLLMDKQLKPALIPPKNKIIANSEIDKQFKQNQNILQTLQKNKQMDSITKPKDPKWDEEF